MFRQESSGNMWLLYIKDLRFLKICILILETDKVALLSGHWGKVQVSCLVLRFSYEMNDY